MDSRSRAKEHCSRTHENDIARLWSWAICSVRVVVLVFGGGGPGAAALVSLDIRKPITAGPPDLDEAGAEAGDSGFG